MVDELSRQIEAAEAEIEQSLATTKKSKKAPAKDEHVSSMEHRNERRNWHISRLEILLRMLENSTLEVDQIKTWLQSNEIKDKKALLDNRRLIETVRATMALLLYHGGPFFFGYRLTTNSANGALQSSRERNEDKSIFERRPHCSSEARA